MIENYKETERQFGEEKTLANAKFVISLYEDVSEKWELEFQALRGEIGTVRTMMYIILAVIPLATAAIIFANNIIAK